MAAAIENMDGIGGLAGWAWIFVIEGLVTVLFGVASFWAVHDFPDDKRTRFLTAEEKDRAIYRLHIDKQASSRPRHNFRWTFVRQALEDWKMWLGMAIYSGATTPLYAFSMFLPTIIRDLGWSTTVVEAQLYSVPPYAAAATFTVLVGWLSDRTGRRGIYNVASSLLAIVGFALLLGSRRAAIGYLGIFLGALGIYPCIPNTISWVSNNVEGVYKRGIVLGFVIGWGNLNGIVSSNVYFSGPHYVEGHAVILAYLVVFLFGASALMMLLLARENKRRRLGLRSERILGKTEDEIYGMGDERPDFFFTV